MGPMGGGGSMQAMNESLKKNRALVKVREKFKGLGDKADSRKKFEFIQSEDIDMKAFMANLREKERKSKQKKIILLITSLIITLLLFYFSDVLIGFFFSGEKSIW